MLNTPVYIENEYKVLTSKFGDIPTYTFTMKVKDLLAIYYVAVRGVDIEEGAVQRVLSKSRISAIRDYILEGNNFFNSFILNWTEENLKPVVENDLIKISLVPSSAQVIDGQHRLAGLDAANKIDTSGKVGEKELLVTLCLGLTTKQAAEIFLNINTEQKPVPKSLMYDLFGEVVSDEEHCINRATDIAKLLNEDVESSFYKLIKFPGSPRGVGSIDLSTFVSAFKESLKKDGRFYNYKISQLDNQKALISNFYQAIKNYYIEAKIWNSSSKNPFLKASGFNGSIDFLLETLIGKCAERKSFTVKTIMEIIDLDKNDLLIVEDLKGLDGKTARKKVKESLERSSLQSVLDEDHNYEF
ncbi:DGQHR domain-containing protein [Acinetobacter courvalinii]|uniref:DGQHR domain-containing protein n=1 Tax=Acinetobacter courvalinii TaxID=280147 RepID=UPI0018FF3A5D|nr:DGQHR domain-containing protein [Acinetobacter courvalinii]MBJ9958174.1 DGQHR domain-containing protein [Acinetobacter courvalinii]